MNRTKHKRPRSIFINWKDEIEDKDFVPGSKETEEFVRKLWRDEALSMEEKNILMELIQDKIEEAGGYRESEENPLVDREFLEEYREGLARRPLSTIHPYPQELLDEEGEPMSEEDKLRRIKRRKYKENTIYIGYPKRRRKKKKIRKTRTTRPARKPIPKRTISREGMVSGKRGRRPWWYLKPPVYVTTKRDEKVWEKACRRASQGGKEPSYGGVTQIYKTYLARAGRPYVSKSVANIEGEEMIFGCLNCEHTFKHSAGRDVKCPECGSYETNAWKEASENIEGTEMDDFLDIADYMVHECSIEPDNVSDEEIKDALSTFGLAESKENIVKVREILLNVLSEEDSIDRERKSLTKEEFEEMQEHPQAEENRLIAVPAGLMFQKAYGWTKTKVKSWLKGEGLRVPKNTEIQSIKINNRLFFKVKLKEVSKDVSYAQKHLGEGVWAFYAKT